jgi:hypothetical protein
MKIVSRSEWGARPWTQRPTSVPFIRRSEFMVHYHGDEPKVSVGVGVPRDCEAIHLAKKWIGVGYNFLVDQNGTAYEGRGWTLEGAHCPAHNVIAFGVYVAVGGSQEPSPAALQTVRELYDKACLLTGRNLRKTWHGANYATECPGVHLTDWVKAGMPMPQEEAPMALSNDDLNAIANRLFSADDARFKCHDVDENGEEVLIPMVTAIERILYLLRGRSAPK